MSRLLGRAPREAAPGARPSDRPQRQTRDVGRPPARAANRWLVAAALTAGALAGVTACAAGQHAQTTEERPSIDGIYGKAGALNLGGVALLAPTSGTNWPPGSSVPLSVYIANTGRRDDQLVSVSSPAFSGWGVVDTGAASTSAVSISASASPTPSSMAGSAVPTAGATQQPQSIPAGGALRLGLNNLFGSGIKAGKTLIMTGAKIKLWPALSVPITFKFAHSGSVTMRVPVQLSSTPASEYVSGTNTSGEAGVKG